MNFNELSYGNAIYKLGWEVCDMAGSALNLVENLVGR